MPALKNPRHEEFAQLVGTGTSKAEAYRKVYKAKVRTAEVEGSKLAKSPEVTLRITEVRTGYARHVQQKAEDKLQDRFLSIDEKREFLAGVIRAKPEDAGFGNKHCELAMTKMGPAAVFPSKLKAIQLDNELAGHVKIEPPTVNVAVGVQTTILTPERHQTLLAKKRAVLDRRRALSAG